MDIQAKETGQETQSRTFVGIDVGAEELVLVVRQDGKPSAPQAFPNTAAAHTRLSKKLAGFPGCSVCLEATGIYHFDLAVALHDAGVAVMVVNPKATHTTPRH